MERANVLPRRIAEPNMIKFHPAKCWLGQFYRIGRRSNSGLFAEQFCQAASRPCPAHKIAVHFSQRAK